MVFGSEAFPSRAAVSSVAKSGVMKGCCHPRVVRGLCGMSYCSPGVSKWAFTVWSSSHPCWQAVTGGLCVTRVSSAPDSGVCALRPLHTSSLHGDVTLLPRLLPGGVSCPGFEASVLGYSTSALDWEDHTCCKKEFHVNLYIQVILRCWKVVIPEQE